MFLKLLFTVFCLFVIVHGENKFMNRVKNSTENNNRANKTEENILKIEAKKYLKECGNDYSAENDGYKNDDEKFYNGGYNNPSVSIGGDMNESDEDCSDVENSQNRMLRKHYHKRDTTQYQNKYIAPNDDYRNNNNNNRRNIHRHRGPCNHNNDDYDYDDDEDRHSNRRGNKNRYNNNRNPNRYNENSSGDGRNNYPYQYGNGYNTGRNDYNYQQSYSPETFLRSKRSDEDAQCVSQCVFGYLEVLNDNRVPSESAIIKFLQDHIPNAMKRIRALREARRCFAKLATTDNEDGCEFSKALSKCLKLDLEK